MGLFSRKSNDAVEPTFEQSWEQGANWAERVHEKGEKVDKKQLKYLSEEYSEDDWAFRDGFKFVSKRLKKPHARYARYHHSS